MDWLAIIQAFFRLIGLARWVGGEVEQHVEAVKAQEVANAPKTKEELVDDLRHGDL